MFVYSLFTPTSNDGVIFSLQQSSPASYAPFRWDTNTRTWFSGNISMDRFMTLPVATAQELVAAGLKPSDFVHH